MRSFFAHKFWIILLSAVALLALTELAIGMKNMKFREAQKFAQRDIGETNNTITSLLNSVTSVPLETQLVVLTLIVGMLVLVGVLLSPELRKRLLRAVIRGVLTFVVVYLIFMRFQGNALDNVVLGAPAAGIGPALPPGGNPAPVYIPPQIPAWVSYAVSFGITALLVFVAWRAYLIWKALNIPTVDTSRNQLARIARASLNDLTSGLNSSDVIMNCYYRMSEVVAHKKRLDRKDSMTPGEFAARLEQAGLPAEDVHTLTRLFESVRYGGYRTSPKMVNEAVACLTTILDYCGEPV